MASSRVMLGLALLLTILAHSLINVKALPRLGAYPLQSIYDGDDNVLSQIFSKSREAPYSLSETDDQISSYLERLAVSDILRNDNNQDANPDRLTQLESFLPSLLTTEDRSQFGTPPSSLLENVDARMKRQQGWHTRYGKRSELSNDYSSILDNLDLESRDKRQQGWHINYGKRNGQASDYLHLLNDVIEKVKDGAGRSDVTDDYLSKIRGEDSDSAQFLQSWQLLDALFSRGLSDSDNGLDSGRISKSSSVLDNTAQFDLDKSRAMSKRQQGWHTPYGKRAL